MEKSAPVRVLPDGLANRIAAGEVVERPASVVKELLENAVDAGAESVTVLIEGAGKKRICISDDGCGMGASDARLAIERHATSKIVSSEDLFAIRTLGFRGEALPSIASVSLFTLSSSDGSETGNRLHIEGGELKRVEEIAFNRGTEVDVRELFFNTPARRKFMKADATELAAITEVVQRIALSKPNLRVRYTHNGREMLNAPPVEELYERAASVFGRKVYPKLFPVEGRRGELVISGLVSMPEHTRTSPSQLHLFLNGRAIRDRLLLHAVRAAYGNMLEPRRFPIGALMLTMPLEDVDVNVHPGKAEVRFANSREIYRFICDAVREALGRSPQLGGAGIPGGQRGSAPLAGEMPDRVADAMGRFGDREQRQGRFSIPGGYVDQRMRTGYPSPDEEGQEGAGAGAFPLAGTEMAGSGAFSSLTVLAQLHNSYILVSSPGGLGIIDQHAAHERVTYERLKKSYEKRAVERQMLLFPVRVELDAGRMAALEEFTEAIEQMGFEVESFGGDSVQVREVPRMLSASDPAAMLKDLLDDFHDVSGSTVVEEQRDRCLATLACHASVRANDAMSYEQMIALLRQMDDIDFSGHCPHGRPVYIEVSQQELEKRFGRTS